MFGTLKTHDIEQCREMLKNTTYFHENDKYFVFMTTGTGRTARQIIMTLLGCLYFQVYKNLEEGKAYAGKFLPVVVKNYKETRPKTVIIYVGQYFGIFPFLEFLQIYAECALEVRRLLDPILAKV